jgi:hypothetical protein
VAQMVALLRSCFPSAATELSSAVSFFILNYLSITRACKYINAFFLTGFIWFAYYSINNITMVVSKDYAIEQRKGELSRRPAVYRPAEVYRSIKRI